MIFSFSDIPQEFTGLLVPTFWCNGARIASTGATGVGAHKALVPQAKSRGDLVYLDCEANGQDLNSMLGAAKVFAGMAPAIRRGMYGPAPLGAREDYIAAAQDTSHALHGWFLGWKPVFDLLDYVNIPSYLLGEKWVDRDLAYIDAHAALAREHYPNCKLIFSVWGNFHTAWNPVAPLPHDVMERYVRTIRRHKADAIVFDAQVSRDMEFVRRLAA